MRLVGLEVEIKELAHLDSDALDDAELGELLVDLARLRTRFEAIEVALSSAWDARRAWAVDGARSGAAWLARQTHEPKPACGARLWLGRKLRHLPLVAVAYAAGDITEAHARLIAKARNHRTAAAMAAAEAEIVHHAQKFTFSQFTTYLDYWLLGVDPDGADRTDIERCERRRVSLDATLSGMRSGSILLDPVNGEIVGNELERLEQELFEADRAEARERLGRDPLTTEVRRTGDQRRADALVEMAKRSAAMPADAKMPRPLFTVVLGNDAFSHLTQLASGQVLSASAILPWISDADLERILFARGTSRVIDVSRKRAFTGALRRLIEVRDQLCYHDTCDEPAHRCQVDHIVPWTQGGITAQWNGRLACGYHNRLRNRPPPAAG